MDDSYPVGVLDYFIKTSGAAGNQTTSLRPATRDEEWLILQAWAYHDDGTGSRAMQWAFTDARNSAHSMGLPSYTIATLINLSIYHMADPTTLAPSSPRYPYKATYNIYPTVTATSLAAGKYLYTRAILIKRMVTFPGPDDETKKITYPRLS